MQEIKDTVIYCEKEKEIKFSLAFKWILALSIFLTGFLSIAGIVFFIVGISKQIWIINGINYFLNQSLFYISDGTIFMIGVLGILFSKIIQYGFIYQKNIDMTI